MPFALQSRPCGRANSYGDLFPSNEFLLQFLKIVKVLSLGNNIIYGFGYFTIQFFFPNHFKILLTFCPHASHPLAQFRDHTLSFES